MLIPLNVIYADPSNIVIPKRIKKYTLEIHDNKFNYSEIKEAYITGSYYNILVKCNTCFYKL